MRDEGGGMRAVWPAGPKLPRSQSSSPPREARTPPDAGNGSRRCRKKHPARGTRSRCCGKLHPKWKRAPAAAGSCTGRGNAFPPLREVAPTWGTRSRRCGKMRRTRETRSRRRGKRNGRGERRYAVFSAKVPFTTLGASLEGRLADRRSGNNRSTKTRPQSLRPSR